jgi:hypothetical protein
MDKSNKCSYAVWFEDQLGDFLRGCEARNDSDADNCYGTIDHWYNFYKQKCSNDSQAVDELLGIKALYSNQVRLLLEKNAYNEIKSSWEALGLIGNGSFENSKFVFERLVIHIKEKIESRLKSENSDKSNDGLRAVRAAAATFIIEKYEESSGFAFGNEDRVIKVKELERQAANRLTEIQNLNHMLALSADEISQLKYKHEQLHNKLRATNEENTRLKLNTIELTKTRELIERKYSELDQQKLDIAAENSHFRSQISEYVTQIEDHVHQAKRLQKQQFSDKDNFMMLTKQNQDMIDSIKRFHKEEISQIKNNHEQEMSGMSLKLRDLEIRKEEEVKQIEFMAKTFVDQRHKEISGAMNELVNEKIALKGEIGILRVKLQEHSAAYQKLKSQTDQILEKYKRLKAENTFMLQEVQNSREKCNDKDLTVATLQARCINLNHQTFMNTNDLKSNRNSVMENNSIEIPPSSDEQKLNSRINPSTRSHNISIQLKANRVNSSDLNKEVESSYLHVTRENLHLKEQLASISQKFRSVDRLKEHKLSRLNDELSTVHFLIKNFNKREHSKTLGKIDLLNFPLSKKESTSKPTQEQTRHNLKASTNGMKTVIEKSALCISNITNTRIEKKNSRFQLYE